MPENQPVPGIQGISQRGAVSREAAAKQAAAQKLLQYSVAQEAATEEFQEWGDLNAWNPMALARNFQQLDRRLRAKTEHAADKSEKTEEEEEIQAVDKLQKIAENYEKKNPEIQARTLLSIQARISKNDTPEDILRKLKDVYLDVALVDEALDFLIETADAEMRILLEKAKEELYRVSEREVRAGRNMAVAARTFSAQGLGSPTALRDLYRELTGNPRDAASLFQQLSSQYPIDRMRTVIDFILHSLGADVKAKGPSIGKEELLRMMSETRNMQAILSIYRYFISRMNLIQSSFDRQGLVLPSRINFDLLARIFVQFLMERYPSPEKALLLAKYLGIADEISAQLIIYLQYRDATRQVAPRLFRDEKHRQDVLMSLMETLEELEEKLEKDEKEKKKKK